MRGWPASNRPCRVSVPYSEDIPRPTRRPHRHEDQPADPGRASQRSEVPVTVLEQVKSAPMSPVQARAVALCLVINLVDGFDLLVTSFVGPTIAREWGLSPSQLGILLSSGLAGMAVGALFLAPLADRIGRRRLTLGCLVLASLGMLAASAAQDFGQLLAC